MVKLSRNDPYARIVYSKLREISGSIPQKHIPHQTTAVEKKVKPVVDRKPKKEGDYRPINPFLN